MSLDESELLLEEDEPLLLELLLPLLDELEELLEPEELELPLEEDELLPLSELLEEELDVEVFHEIELPSLVATMVPLVSVLYTVADERAERAEDVG